MIKQLAVIGCGLMGGSFALAVKQAGLVRRVVAYSRSLRSLEVAQRMGAIDAAAVSPDQAAQGSDVVVLAVPVGATGDALSALRPHLAPEGLCMDVGSTKLDVVRAAQQALGPDFARFVPAHPIAGKELAGIEHADAELYRGCRVILTPTGQTDPSALERSAQIWSALGAHVMQMQAEEHDRAFAAVSHLPHLLAFAFIGGIASQPDKARLLQLAGPGFRDFSRIAAGDATLWRDVLLANREQVLAQGRAFRAALEHLEEALRAGDAQAVHALIAEASAVRSAWNLPQRPVLAGAGLSIP